MTVWAAYFVFFLVGPELERVGAKIVKYGKASSLIHFNVVYMLV